MSNTQLIGLKLNIDHHLNEMRPLCFALTRELENISDLEFRTTAIQKTDEDKWIRLPDEKIRDGLSIFHRFTYRVDQDPKESIKFPAIIQLSERHHSHIKALVDTINDHKNALLHCNGELKSMLGRKSSAAWQDIISYASIIQILRHISTLVGDFNYLGLSYLTKPVVKPLSRDAALKYIDEKITFYENSVFGSINLSFLDNVRKQVSDVDESSFEIKMARQGSPRVMLNAKTDSKESQVMASMPVILFSDRILPVSIPKGLKRKARSDKRIPLGEVKSDFGLYLIPK